jgi:hypothetical protein
MKLTSKILKSFLYQWAATILWIYIGSLVNFHQHKIWGRPLLPQLLYAKRDKEQSIDYNKLIKPDIPKEFNPVDFSFFTGIPVSISHEFCISSSFVRFNPTAGIFLTKRFILFNGLRAPPLS